MSFWDAGLHQLMEEALVPGASWAIVRDGRIAEVASCGVRHAQSPLSVDDNTVFDAASLRKPVFADVVLQLVDQNQLTLDTLLASMPSAHQPSAISLQRPTRRGRFRPVRPTMHAFLLVYWRHRVCAPQEPNFC